MTSHALAAALAVSFALVACGERSNSPIKTTDTLRPGTTDTVAASAPPAPTDRDSPPASTPTTHAQTPNVVADPLTPTARDTPAAGPMKTLTPEEEAKSMPKPGQTDNFLTPSLQGESKGTQQSPGSTAPQVPAPAK